MSETPLAKKLRIQPGQRILLLNPPPGYLDGVDLPEGIELAEKPEGTFDFVHLFVKNTAELESLGPTAKGSEV